MAINTTTSTQSTTYLNKTWYDKSLLEWAKTKQVHTKYGQKRKVPAGQGKKVEFRGFEPFDPADALTALTEGVTPEGQDLTQRHVEVTVPSTGGMWRSPTCSRRPRTTTSWRRRRSCWASSSAPCSTGSRATPCAPARTCSTPAARPRATRCWPPTS